MPVVAETAAYTYTAEIEQYVEAVDAAAKEPEDPFLAWQKAGAVVYNVPGGFFVAFGGRILAVAHPTYDSAIAFRELLTRAGVAVLDYPGSGEEAGAMLQAAK
jgi:hypothetical protein